MDTGLEKFIKLREVVEEIAAQFGLELMDYSVAPGDKAGDRPSIRLGIKITPEALLNSQERDQKRIDKQFESITFNIDEDDTQQKVVDEIKSSLQEWIDNDE